MLRVKQSFLGSVPLCRVWHFSTRSRACKSHFLLFYPIVLLINLGIQVLHSAVWGQCMPVVDAWKSNAHDLKEQASGGRGRRVAQGDSGSASLKGLKHIWMPRDPGSLKPILHFSGKCHIWKNMMSDYHIRRKILLGAPTTSEPCLGRGKSKYGW